jgi:hypothetical protein
MGRPAGVCHPRCDGRMIQPARRAHPYVGARIFTATEAIDTPMPFRKLGLSRGQKSACRWMQLERGFEAVAAKRRAQPLGRSARGRSIPHRSYWDSSAQRVLNVTLGSGIPRKPFHRLSKESVCLGDEASLPPLT